MARTKEPAVPQIIEHIAVLSHGTKGWSCQLNLISWNNGPIYLDIRNWSYDMQHHSKKGAFTRDEAIRLHRALTHMNLEAGYPQVEDLGMPDPPENSRANSGFGFASPGLDGCPQNFEMEQ